MTLKKTKQSLSLLSMLITCASISQPVCAGKRWNSTREWARRNRHSLFALGADLAPYAALAAMVLLGRRSTALRNVWKRFSKSGRSTATSETVENCQFITEQRAGRPDLTRGRFTSQITTSVAKYDPQTGARPGNEFFQTGYTNQSPTIIPSSEDLKNPAERGDWAPPIDMEPHCSDICVFRNGPIELTKKGKNFLKKCEKKFGKFMEKFFPEN